MPRFCPNCGAAVPEVGNFCPKCGKALVAAPAPPPVQQAPSVQYAQPAQPQPQPQPAQYSQPAPSAPQPQPQPQYAPPAPGFRLDKQTLLSQAPNALNRPDQPWYVSVEGDSLVARWKWMDAYFFSPHEVNDETRNYTFTVNLSDKGTWKELDTTDNKSKHVSFGPGGLSLGGSTSTFKGKTNQKSFTFGAGKDKVTDEVGLISFKFDTTAVKQPIRNYLAANGWQKG